MATKTWYGNAVKVETFNEMGIPVNYRSRPHNRHLPERKARLTDCSFMIRMLYRYM